MSRELYVCEECNLVYKEKIFAEKCERWCREYGSCNMDIIKHAIGSLNVGAPKSED